MGASVYAVVSIYEDHGLLPHFLEHYDRLGVRRTFVVVRTPTRGALAARAAEAAAGRPAAATWVECDRFADPEKAAVEERVLRAAGVDADDFVMRLDLDEFHEYPAPLAEVVGPLGRRRDRAVRGRLVDRVAEGGVLAPVRPDPDLGLQFPIGCELTGGALGGWTQKVMICRAGARLRGGVNHDALGVSYEPPPAGPGDGYLVHHFKWTEGVASRLRSRLGEADVGPEYRRECRRFLELAGGAGRIDLSDASLLARRLGPLARPA
ncbi:hypothetical protein [Planctomyces sp. SH-PL62]|uniref:hypothetical protein n=1 Tax=Planctomyces sp. SH-PL62 TaxID=1636152 RepID=UPI00078B4645|nr:hypothetical protein [Planctomyces sp. SH-PL62]AMV40975.1 hypothetical protein VT85_26305 [Planctomyces sp. SH-PL62]